jgi:hypothetical protein
MILDEDGETKFEDGLEALRADIQRAQNEGISKSLLRTSPGPSRAYRRVLL